MRKLFKERKLFKGGNYMRKYGSLFLFFQIQTFTWARFDVILVLFHGSVNAFCYYLLCIIWSAYQKIKEELSNPAITRP